jgi:hypothetical protein
MTDLAAKALELARAALGVTEHPPGSNRGEQVDRYLRRVGLDPAKGAYAWCAAFVSCMILDAADALPTPRQFRGSYNCHHLVGLNAALEIGTPEVGCIGVHFADAIHGHAFFVTEVLGGGIVSTLEGNSDAHGSRTGGSVVLGTRSRGYVNHWLLVK